jgi:uncharacterized phage-associated protein
MVTVFDVAHLILAKQGEMTAMKLQKLIYYAQAWSLVWDERPLFLERIEAWANGPVCRALYDRHRGKYSVTEADIPGDPSTIDADGLETIDAVLAYYGPRPARWLSDLTHQEAPWREARQGLGDGERGESEITHAAMAEFYEALL